MSVKQELIHAHLWLIAIIRMVVTYVIVGVDTVVMGISVVGCLLPIILFITCSVCSRYSWAHYY